MALLERDIGHSLLSDKTGPVWLDELDPTRGEAEAIDIDCSLICSIVDDEMNPAPMKGNA